MEFLGTTLLSAEGAEHEHEAPTRGQGWQEHEGVPIVNL
jgi:hypothetical protein